MIFDEPMDGEAVFEVREAVAGPHQEVRFIDLIRNEGFNSSKFRYRKLGSEECKTWADGADLKFRKDPSRLKERRLDFY